MSNPPCDPCTEGAHCQQCGCCTGSVFDLPMNNPPRPGYPRFAPDAELVVDAHNGHEVWTGAEWNEYVESAERNLNIVTARLIECPPPVTAPEGRVTR